MTELNVFNGQGIIVKKIKLPAQFTEELRVDLIKRAVLSYISQNRQAFGANPEAGFRHSVRLSRRRKDYKTAYKKGISRTPRKTMSRRGTQFNWVGAFSPNTVGGRRAHPYKSEKDWEEKINNKEKNKAIRSALAATLKSELVSKRGHIVPKNYPLALSNDVEKISKLKDVRIIFEKLGLDKEIERCKEIKIRSGKAALRGRKNKKKVGMLLVVSDEKSNLLKAARNFQGFDVISIHNLNAKLLAPGTHAGRLTVYTESAIEKLEKEKLYS